MSFGQRKAAQTFRRFMNEILKDLDFCFAYLEGIIVFSRSAQDHDQTPPYPLHSTPNL
jgi:hypothetical protein